MNKLKLRFLLAISVIVLTGAQLGKFIPVWAAAPTVANPIANQNAVEDAAFNFQFAANTFSDADLGDTLTYNAQLAGGGALPAWLSFDPVTRTFSGTPTNSDVGTVSIDVIADDGNGGSVTDMFDIIVASAQGPSFTLAPSMEAPASNTTYGLIPVRYELGETPLAGSVRLTFIGSDTITITANIGSPAVGPYEYSINPANVLASGASLVSTSQNVIPDGTYTVVLSYQNANGDPAASVNATNVTVDSDMIDTDGDGSLDVVEEAGPNNGDANDDGIADSEQANVITYENPLTSNYAVLETDCERIENFQIGAESTELPDTDYDYPMGLASFWIYCENAGDTARIQHYYYGVEGSNLYSVRKWMNDGSYREIPGYQPLGALIGGDVVFMTQYEITDGSEFDDDGNQDAVIRDPSGAALRVAQTPSESTPSNSFTTSLASSGLNTETLSALALTLIGSGASVGIYSRKRQSN